MPHKNKSKNSVIKKVVQPGKSMFWSIVLGIAMLVLMPPLPPHSPLSARAQTACVPPPAGMVGWWPADGNANDIAGSNPGTMENGATFAAGKVAQAFSFDGGASIVRIASSSSLEPQQVSVNAWVFAESVGGGADSEGPVVVSKDTAGTSAGGGVSYAILGPGTTGKFNAYVRFTDATQPRVISTNSFSFGAWHHVAMTWDGTTLNLYVDGNLEGSTIVGAKTIAYSAHNLGIGSHPLFGSRVFDGLIDEVEVFNRALTAAEIQDIFNAGSAGSCKSPVSPGPFAYVTNPGAVLVIDRTTNTVVSTIPITGNSSTIAFTPDGGRAYVVSGFSNTVTVINTATIAIVATFSLGNSLGKIAFTPDGKRAYLPSEHEDRVLVIDTTTNTLSGSIPVGDNPYALDVTPDGTRAYVGNYASNDVSVIDTSSNTVIATITGVAHPQSLDITPNGTRAYVVIALGTVAVIDLTTNTVLRHIPVHDVPGNITIAPDGCHAYLTYSVPGGPVSVIDLNTDTIVADLPIGAYPLDVALTPDSARAFVTGSASGVISVVNATTNTVIHQITVGPGGDGNGPYAVGVPPSPEAIDFETAPGPDGELHTSDDVPLAPATEISNQFASLGVTFSFASGGIHSPSIATAANPSFIAFVGPQGYNAPARSGVNSISPGIGTLYSVQVDFAFGVSSVGLYELDLDNQPQGEGRPQLDLIAFDASGHEVGRSSLATPGFPAGDGSILPLFVSGRGIRRVVIDYANCGDNGVAFDDLTFVREGNCPGANQPPTITCPVNITQATDPAQCTAVVNYPAPTATGSPTPIITCSPASGAAFPKGTTTVTCTAANGVSPDAACSFNVTVNDTQAPTISCPSNITVPNQCSAAAVSYAAPSATDNCSVAGPPVCSPPSGSTFPLGPTTVMCAVTDTVGLTSQCSFTVTLTPPQLTAPGPARVWIGLKNSDDVGTKFDLLGEVLKNGAVIGSGQLNEVPGGSSGFNNAILDTINLTMSTPSGFCSGDTLSFRLSVRVAAGSGHVSGTARLWYHDSAANSRFTATLGGTTADYFLLNGLALGASAGSGPKKSIDVLVNRSVGGNPFKPFGTWSITF